jgi:hypothetical protein
VPPASTISAPPAIAPAPLPTAATSTTVARRAPAAPAAPAVAQPAAPVQDEVPRVAPTTAAVAELYGSVGRALKRLDETRGQQATYDLWPRFRHIQILEALRTDRGRAGAHSELSFLEREITRRGH